MEDNQKRSTCLVCYDDFATKPDSNENFAQKSTISKHLRVIFILKCIFELPSNQLSLYLQNRPKIEHWITICGTCDKLIVDCESVYQDLLEVDKKFRATKQRIVEIVKTGYNESQNNRGSKLVQLEDGEFVVMDECRCFITQHKYRELVNPFNEGDAKAQELQNQSFIRQEVDVKVEIQEFPTFDDTLYHDDFGDWEPSNDVETTEEKIQVSDAPAENQKQKTGRKPGRPKSKVSATWKEKKKTCDSYEVAESKDGDGADWKPDSLAVEEPVTEEVVQPSTPENQTKRKLYSRKSKASGVKKQKKIFTRLLDDDDNDVKNDSSDEMDWEPESSSEIEEPPDEFKEPVKKRKTNKIDKPTVKKGPTVKCLICGHLMWDKRKLIRHNRVIHGPHQCDLCPNNFSTKMRLHFHQIEVHNKPSGNNDHKKRSLLCTEPDCDAIVPSLKDMELHFQTAHKEAPKLICSECGKTYYTKARMQSHKSCHNNLKKAKSATCEYCGLTFKSVPALTTHQKNTLKCKLLYLTEAEATVVCDQCGGRFPSEKKLKVHKKTVHDEEREMERNKEKFYCEKCGTGYKKKSLWQLHMFEEHQISTDSKGNKKSFYKCTEPGCDKVFRENKRLQDHLTQHRGEPQYKCDICEKQFYFPNLVTSHKMTVHNKGLRFTCDLCEKVFTCMIYLKQHKSKKHRAETSTEQKLLQVNELETP